MLTRKDTYRELYDTFRWQVPERFNIGEQVSDRWSDSGRTAMLYPDDAGALRTYTFGDLSLLSNRLANTLTGHGLAPGDRVAVLLPQVPETAVAHIAIYKSGMVALPLFTLFGEEALEFRLTDSGARALITDRANYAKVAALRDRLPDLEVVFTIDGREGDTFDFHERLGKASDAFRVMDTSADDPAFITYTSGTTGPPKGALHAHRVLLGHMPGVAMPQEFFPQDGDLFWTPADWAWLGGLLNVLLPSLYCGIPVLANPPGKFDPEQAFALIAEHGVRNSFLPPTALKMMRQVPDPRARHDLSIRSIGSGGEALGTGLLDWGRETFGITINEFYGQTECNLVLANCASVMEVRPGSMGREVPGHRVGIISDDGNEVPAGEVGHVAIRRPDPVMFLEYWNDPAATRDKFVGDWMLTGDTGRVDEDGYYWFVGRADDVITSAGYRIGPGEIEDCLLKHPAVAMVAVIGVPDPERTESIKAFIVLNDGHQGDDALAREVQAFVKSRLAAHEYPRAVAFVDSLPLTATGKVMRRTLRDREIANATDPE